MNHGSWISHLLDVLVLLSPSLDHMSGSSSSLLLSTARALHIIVDGLRFVRPLHRSMSKPANAVNGVVCLLLADIFPRSHNPALPWLACPACPVNEDGARAGLDGELGFGDDGALRWSYPAALDKEIETESESKETQTPHHRCACESNPARAYLFVFLALFNSAVCMPRKYFQLSLNPLACSVSCMCHLKCLSPFIGVAHFVQSCTFCIEKAKR